MIKQLLELVRSGISRKIKGRFQNEREIKRILKRKRDINYYNDDYTINNLTYHLILYNFLFH